jgi:hypothetical protein
MKQQPASPDVRPDAQQQPWWRHGMLWLIIGGPLAVVLASLVTAAIAVSGAEEVLTRPAPSLNAKEAHLLPAVQARNHAATPRH